MYIDVLDWNEASYSLLKLLSMIKRNTMICIFYQIVS